VKIWKLPVYIGFMSKTAHLNIMTDEKFPGQFAVWRPLPLTVKVRELPLQITVLLP